MMKEKTAYRKLDAMLKAHSQYSRDLISLKQKSPGAKGLESKILERMEDLRKSAMGLILRKQLNPRKYRLMFFSVEYTELLLKLQELEAKQNKEDENKAISNASY